MKKKIQMSKYLGIILFMKTPSNLTKALYGSDEIKVLIMD